MPDLPWYFLVALAAALVASTALVVAAVRIGAKAATRDLDEEDVLDLEIGP